MAEVFKTGTAYFLKVDGIEICGKTGTADNFARVNGKKVMLKPHSVFVAFAPKVNPKIAIAVLVENGGFGSTVAGPITTLMLEKYIKKEITMKDREKRVLETSLQGEYNRFTRKYLDSMYKIKIRKDSILRTINTKKLDSIKKSKPTT
ncbi:penicillin-binding protein 2 [Flavobacterium psychrophilum]|nr:penicillin-binding protein 2 [Flavobacterium psychrophilum]